MKNPFPTVSPTRDENNKTAWDKLRADDNSGDYKKAKFLTQVLARDLHGAIGTLPNYLIVSLEEPAGKRVSALVRMVAAFAEEQRESVWRKLGGNGVVLLTNAPKSKRKAILARVEQALKNPKGRRKDANGKLKPRLRVSNDALRTALVSVLGQKGYEAIRIEKRKAPESSYNYKSQCIDYQQELFRLLRIRKLKPQDVKPHIRHLLGMDTDASAA